MKRGHENEIQKERQSPEEIKGEVSKGKNKRKQNETNATISAEF